MIVFLTRIPAHTKYNDIFKFIDPWLKGNLFRRSGYIRKINILNLKDPLTDKLEYHALVTIEPDNVANRVIKKLNRKAIKGKHIAVREYVLRNWHNDRRLNIHQWNEEHKDKRRHDRRRKKIQVIDSIVGRYQNHDSF